MVAKPLFYQSIVPLNRDLHKALKLNSRDDRFAFAASSNVIPAVIDEFVPASRHLPILFLPGPKLPSPVFLTGLRSGETPLVDQKGRWQNDYLPAFLRRYPFIIGDVVNSDPIVCIDEESALFQNGAEPLFLADGADSPCLQTKIVLMNEYNVSAKRTEHFVETLVDLDLLTAITINVQQADAGEQTLHGLTMVDHARFEHLSDDDFLRLRAHGFLAAIYAHLASLSSIDRLNVQASSGDTAVPVKKSSRRSGVATSGRHHEHAG